MFQDRWVVLAKIYYTLEALGEEARLSPEVFTAIHGKGTNLSYEKTFFDWAASKGLDRKKVEDMYNSFAIAGKMNRAKAAGADVQHPVGADDRRRRQVRRPSTDKVGHARGAAGGDRRADRQGARRAAEDLTVGARCRAQRASA